MTRTAQPPRRPDRHAGFLATIDGPVGVGKTTVTTLVAASLTADGVPVLATRQPSDSPLGTLARSGTHDLHGLALTFLMAADRHHHYEHVIGPALAAGHVVVCDRYIATALALDQIDGADPKFVWDIYRYLSWPDLAIILVGDPAVCRARAEQRGIYSRFHEGGLAAAITEASLYADTVGMLADRGYPVVIIPIGDRGADEVAQDVTMLIRDRLTCCWTAPEKGERSDEGRAALPRGL